MIRRTALLAALLLTACGDGAEDAVPTREADEAQAEEQRTVAPPEAPAPSDADLPTATIADVLGTFEGKVHGLAVWEHPTTPYLGSVVAANGAAGLAMIPLDPETAPRTTPGTFDGGVGAGYLEDGESLIAAASGDETILFGVADDRTLTEQGRLDGGADHICFADGLVILVGPRVRVHDAATGGEVQAPDLSDVVACASGAGGVFLIERIGGVSLLDRGNVSWAGRAQIAVTPGVLARSEKLEIASVTGEEGTVFVQALIGAALTITPFGGAGTELGTLVRLRKDDQADETPITALAAGSGNYGGIYRDGVVVVLDDRNRLKAVPWSGLARAAGLPVETTGRRPQPEATDPFAVTPTLPELSLPDAGPTGARD